MEELVLSAACQEWEASSKKHGGVEVVRRERKRKREREMRGRGESLLLTHMHTYTPETQGLPSPTTHTSSKQQELEGLVHDWVWCLQMHTWLPALHFTKSQLQQKTYYAWSIDDPLSGRNQPPSPQEANSFSYSAGLPINDQEPTSYQTISTHQGWAETLINNKCGSAALK